MLFGGLWAQRMVFGVASKCHENSMHVPHPSLFDHVLHSTSHDSLAKVFEKTHRGTASPLRPIAQIRPSARPIGSRRRARETWIRSRPPSRPGPTGGEKLRQLGAVLKAERRTVLLSRT